MCGFFCVEKQQQKLFVLVQYDYNVDKKRENLYTEMNE